MSFFDEADEPEPTPRAQIRRPRGAGRPPRGAGRPPGGSGRPPRSQHDQDVQTRRLIAVGVVVVVVLVLALLIKGCESSAATSALKTYSADVYSLMTQSDTTGANAFGSQGLTGQNLSNVNLAGTVHDASAQLSKAESFHAPSEMAGAQAALVLVMRMRWQGLLTIANNAQKAADKSTSKDALRNIAVGTSELYGSDVLYKSVVTPDMAKALNAASLTVGTNAGDVAINPGQVITDLGWLNTTWIATKIGAQLTTQQANINNSQPNLGHGHQLDSVSVAGITLNPTGDTTVPAASAQTWTLYLHNSGQTNENQVVCKLSIQGVESQTATIPQTTPGEATHCTITLPSAPQKGLYSVTATIERVPVENDFNNNHHTYTVTFN